MSLNLDNSTWKCVSFGDVIENVTDRVDDPSEAGVDRYVGLEHLDPGVMTVQRWDTPDRVEAQKLRFQPGDVIFGRRRAYQKKVALAEFEGICSAHALVLRARPGYIHPDFLPVFLSSDYFLDRAIAISVGSLSPTVNWRDLKVQEFDLPPLGKQKRIADLLWAVERHRLACNEIASSVDAAANVRLTDLWKQDRDKRAIGDIAEGVTGSTPSKSNKTFWNSEDVPFYTPSEINSDTMLSARQRVSWAGAAVGRLLPEYAVAVACIGGDMGKSAVIAEPGISNQQITSIVGLQKEDAYALQSLLAHTLGRAAMEARETTTIVRKLNKSDLMKVQIPWPADRTVLRKFVSDRRAAHWALSSEISSLSALRRSILADIFGGN
jgi:type I restriction enzyme S subunit